MKAHRQETKPAFVPVVVTLESQEEVDEMQSLICSNAADQCPALNRHDIRQTLKPFRNEAAVLAVAYSINARIKY